MNVIKTNTILWSLANSLIKDRVLAGFEIIFFEEIKPTPDLEVDEPKELVPPDYDLKAELFSTA